MTDPNATQMLSDDPNRTQMSGVPSINATQTIQPVQCPVCKTFNPAGEAFCIECGLLFASALPDDVFGAPTVRPPCLVDESGREHFLRPGTNLVGREGDVLLQDTRVSRKHAEISMEDGKVHVQDLGSTNGTFVNGEQLAPNEPRELSEGDKVDFAGVKMTMNFPGEAQATQMPVSRKTQAIEAPPRVEPPAAFLVGEAEKHGLKNGENTVGRRTSNDIVISDPYTSGEHGTFDVEDEAIYFTDLGSTNGSFLNGAKLTPNERIKLAAGDQIVIGRTEFKLEMADKEDAIED